MVDFTKLFEDEKSDKAALKDYAADLPNGVELKYTSDGYPYYQAIEKSKLPVEYPKPGLEHTYRPGWDAQLEDKPRTLLPMVGQAIENTQAIVNEGPDTLSNIWDKLAGPKQGKVVNSLSGRVKVEPDATGERYQTWPEKMVVSGLKLPVDVMTGAVATGPGLRREDFSDDPNAPQPLSSLIERTQDLAGLLAGGSVVGTAPKGAIKSGLAKRLNDVMEQDAYHGTIHAGFEKFKPSEYQGYMPDRALGTHVSKDPEIANTFTGRSENWGKNPDEKGGVYKLKIPDDKKFYEVTQDLLPYIKDKNAPKNSRNIHSDQGAIEHEIYKVAYRNDPSMFQRFLKQRWNMTDEKAKIAATDILAGKPYQDGLIGKPDRPIKGLDDYIKYDGVVKSWNEKDRAKAIEIFKKKLQNEGYVGVKYINTSPMETANAKDPTSYIVFDPSKHIKNAYTGQLMSDAETGTAIGAAKNSLANRLKETMPEMLQRQRASEGYEAAIRDPETRKLYTGMWHEEVLDKMAKDKGISKDQLPTNLVKGYIDERGKFWSEQQLENRAKSRTAMFRSDDIVGTGLASALNGGKFYSAVEKAVSDSVMNNKTAEKWLAYLKTQNGVTAEELSTLNLENLPKGNITKEQLANWIKENETELKEVWKDKSYDEKTKILIDKRKEIRDQIDNFRDINRKSKPTDSKELKKLHELDSELTNEIISTTSRTQPVYSKFQLPGGTNYREMILTVPAKKMIPDEAGKRLYDNFVKKGGETDWEKLAPETRQHWIDIAFKDDGGMNYKDTYTHSHWPGIKNPIVHARMNDRFIPEDNGYRITNLKSGHTSKTFDTYEEALSYVNNLPENLKKDIQINEGMKEPLNSLHIEEIQSDLHQTGRREGYKLSKEMKDKLEPEFNRIDDKIINSGDEAIMGNPDIRDAVKMAIEKKIINKAEGDIYLKYSDSERVNAVPDLPFKNSWSDLAIKKLLMKAVEEGKDAISWTPGEANRTNPKNLGNTGEQAEKSNQGFKRFYDEIIVDKVNKIAKKFGGKVEQVKFDLPPEMKVGREYVGGKTYEFKSQPIHVLRITPELRKHILENGFSLFQAEPLLVPVNDDPFKKKHKLVPIQGNPFQ